MQSTQNFPLPRPLSPVELELPGQLGDTVLPGLHLEVLSLAPPLPQQTARLFLVVWLKSQTYASYHFGVIQQMQKILIMAAESDGD